MNNDQPQTMQLDENFLVSMGLGDMPAQDKQAFLMQIQEELEVRVGTALSQNLTDEQLDEFTEIAQSGDQQASITWLEENCPNYQEVVKHEVEALRQEIMQNRDSILTGQFPSAA